MGSDAAIGKRKRAAARSQVPSSTTQPRQLRLRASRTDMRKKRKMTRDTSRLALSSDDGDENEEDEEEDEEPAPHVPPTSFPRPPPKAIDSEKLPILLSLYYGPQKQTGETMFLLSQMASLAEVRSRLFKHFFWEFKRAGVPADLGFIRANCFAPDRDGPCDGAWPIGTAEGYDDWIARLRREEWKQGQFARVQVVAVTDKNMQRMEAWGWQGHGILEPAFWIKKQWLSPWVEEMEGTRWVAEADANAATDGTEWGLE